MDVFRKRTICDAAYNVMAAQGVVADAISDSETAFQAEIEFQGYHV